MIFAAADIPTSFSFVFKEWAFKKAHLDVFFLTACVSWMQLAIVWLFLPLQVRQLPLAAFLCQPSHACSHCC